MSVREVICYLPDVPVCVSITEGAVWSIGFGGSESRGPWEHI